METNTFNIPVIQKSRPAKKESKIEASACCTPKNNDSVCCTPSKTKDENDGACCAQPSDGTPCCDK